MAGRESTSAAADAAGGGQGPDGSPDAGRASHQPFEERHRAVFVISVAAELTGVHPQTLRVYERKGLVSPARTGGMSRRYSEADLDRVRRIQELTGDGLNLAGVTRVLAMEAEIAELRARIAELQSQVDGGSALVPLRQTVKTVEIYRS